MMTLDYILIWLGFLCAAVLFTALSAAACGRFNRRFFQRFLPRAVFTVIFFTLGALALYSFFLRLINTEPSWLFPYTATLAVLYGTFSLALFSRAFAAGNNWAFNRRKRILALSLLVSVAVTALAWMDADRKSSTIFQACRAESIAMAKSVLPPRPPRDQDAASLYENVLKLRRSDNLTLYPWSFHKFFEANKKVKPLSEKRRETVGLLRQATARPHIYHDFDLSHIHISFAFGIRPGIGTYCYSAQLLFLSGREKALEGDFKGAYDDIACIESMSRQVKENQTGSSLDFAKFLNKFYMSSLEYVLANADPPENFFLLPIKVQPTTISDLKNLIIMESAVWLELYYELGKKGEDSQIYGAVNPFINDDEFDMLRKAVPIFLWRVFFFPAEHAGLMENKKSLLNALDEPYFNIPDALRAWEEDRNRSPKPLYEDESTQPINFEMVLAYDAQNRLASLALALTAYRSDKGEYPKSLEELVPAYIASAPIDPFDGKPLKMEEVKGGLRIFSVYPTKEPLDFYLGKEAYLSHRLN